MENILLAVTSLTILSGCGQTITVKNEDFRTGNASGAFLGSIGYVSGEGVLGGTNRFDRKRMPKYRNVIIKNEGIVDYSSISGIDSNLNAKVEAKLTEEVKLKTGIGTDTKTDEKLKVNYHILSFESPDDAIVDINTPDNLRSVEILMDGLESSRIISKVLVAYNYEQSKILNNQTNLRLTGNAGELPIANGVSIGDFTAETEFKINNKESIKLSDGMIVGYSYDILCWKKNKDGEIKLSSSIQQKYGAPVECIKGNQNPDKL